MERCLLFHSPLEPYFFATQYVEWSGYCGEVRTESTVVSHEPQEVKSFLGFVGYYRRFCPDFATIARPLNVLSSKEVRFQWGVEEETAFQQLKTLLIEAPVLTYPDPSRQYILDTDASNEAAGAVLSQMVEGEERVGLYQ